MTLAILPAAGSSRRMGRPKLLLPWGETTVIGAVVAALRGAGVAAPLLVLSPGARTSPGSQISLASDGAPASDGSDGSDGSDRSDGSAGSDTSESAPASGAGESAALLAWAAAHGLPVAFNPHPERGMLSSLVAGLDALGGGAALARRGEVLLVSPADLPALRCATVVALLERMEAARAPLALPRHRGRRGHPLAIAPWLIPEIARLDPAIGLRQLRDRHAGELLEIDVDDPGCVADLDTPEDYAGLLGRARGRPSGP